MRDDTSESFLVCLNHESPARRGVSAIGHTLWRGLMEAGPFDPGIARLGADALALIRSPSPRNAGSRRLFNHTDRAQMSRRPVVVRTVPALRGAPDGLSAKRPRLRWCQPWEDSMTAMCRWSGWRNAATGACFNCVESCSSVIFLFEHDLFRKTDVHFSGSCSKVVVPIFVNPTQSAPSEDLRSYPRSWKADIARLAAENGDPIWRPDVKTTYPTALPPGNPADR